MWQGTHTAGELFLSVCHKRLVKSSDMLKGIRNLSSYLICLRWDKGGPWMWIHYVLCKRQKIKRCFIFYWKMCFSMSVSDKEGIQQGPSKFAVFWCEALKKGEGVSKTVRIISNQNFVWCFVHEMFCLFFDSIFHRWLQVHLPFAGHWNLMRFWNRI